MRCFNSLLLERFNPLPAGSTIPRWLRTTSISSGWRLPSFNPLYLGSLLSRHDPLRRCPHSLAATVSIPFTSGQSPSRETTRTTTTLTALSRFNPLLVGSLVPRIDDLLADDYEVVEFQSPLVRVIPFEVRETFIMCEPAFLFQSPLRRVNTSKPQKSATYWFSFSSFNPL